MAASASASGAPPGSAITAVNENRMISRKESSIRETVGLVCGILTLTGVLTGTLTHPGLLTVAVGTSLGVWRTGRSSQ